ncbi:MAG: 30S ribosome-binding factor RbfA [Lachnospiraceae bacterium]|nr:30S ribosome-binding factor RbfA [Lachnospiraceae bacterium]
MRRGSIKNNRINGEVMRVIAEAIRQSKDPRIAPLTSVTDVQVAADLKTCKVWISVLGNEEETDRTMEGLRHASGYVRSVIAEKLNMRRTPELTFLQDDSAAYAIEITKKIDRVIEEDTEARRRRGETEEEEDA